MAGRHRDTARAEADRKLTPVNRPKEKPPLKPGKKITPSDLEDTTVLSRVKK